MDRMVDKCHLRVVISSEELHFSNSLEAHRFNSREVNLSDAMSD